MKIFRNRTVIGVLCILLALVICFGVTPLFSRSASETTCRQIVQHCYAAPCVDETVCVAARYPTLRIG